MHNPLKNLLLSLALASAVPLAQADMEGKPAPAIPGVGELEGKPTLVDFWASWCGPCQESFPWMQAMEEKYPGLRIIAINLDESRSDADNFLSDSTINFQVVFDPEGELAEKYQVDGMPSSYLIDRDGTIIKQHVGFFPDQTSDYEAEIEKLLESEPAAAE